MNISFLKHLSYSSLYGFNECPACWVERYRDGIVPPKSKALELGSEVHKIVEDYHKGKQLPQYHKYSYYLRAYAQTYKPEDFTAIEDFFTITIPSIDNSGFDLPIPFVGVIDRIWNDEIHELKTSSSAYKQEDIDGRIQTSIYALAYRQKFHKEESRIVYNVLIKKERPTLQLLYTKCTDGQVLDAKRWIWNTFSRIVNTEESEIRHICQRGGL